MKTKYFTKTILILSAISFFTDVASEMLYPIIPIYLRTLGFSIAIIGFLEGIAEALAGISKGYFGAWSDKIGKRVPFIRLGYSLSSIAKPMMGLLPYPFWVFFARTLDRFGKGVRTSARDALLSDESSNENKGKIFGFHRSMDTLGAVFGPLLTLLLINYFFSDYKYLFIFSIIPGIVVIVLCFLLKEKGSSIKYSKTHSSLSVWIFWNYLINSSKNYKKLVIPLLLFSLFNSSDFFLLLKLKEYGFTDTNVVLYYIQFNFSYSLLSFPAGKLADKIGFQKVLTFGLFIFSLVYTSINLSGHFAWLIFVFFIYGFFNASTEGISKALITNIVPKEETATALGSFNAFYSIVTLLASSITGLIWSIWGSTVALFTSGLAGFLIFVYFAIFFNLKTKNV